MKNHYLSIQTKAGRYRHFKVCWVVYNYVKQLENAIKYPELSKIKEVYPDKFKKHEDPPKN